MAAATFGTAEVSRYERSDQQAPHWRPLRSAVATACAAALPAQATDPVAAKQTSSRQSVSVSGQGSRSARLAGGPFGAIVGAAAGAWLGDRYHEARMSRTARSRADLAHGHARSAPGSAAAWPSCRSHERAAGKMLERRTELETQVVFRTNDATLPPVRSSS